MGPDPNRNGIPFVYLPLTKSTRFIYTSSMTAYLSEISGNLRSFFLCCFVFNVYFSSLLTTVNVPSF